MASDLSTEVKSLISKHIAKNRNNYIWHKELGKDLLNYLSRPDFLIGVVHYIRTYGTDILYSVTVEFLQAVTEAQIKSLLESKVGTLLLDEIQGWLQTSSEPFNLKSADAGKLREMYIKIERVRIPIIVKDSRPYVGEMVGADEDMGIDPSIINPRAAPFYHYRFGGNHDGEHWLTKSVGAQVKATATIKGTVLTRYYQQAEQGSARLANVLILLDGTEIVMIVKDLVTLGPKTQAISASTPDNDKTKAKDESKFTDKTGKPISTIKLVAGDVIGTTTNWDKLGAAKYFPEYNRQFGTFHFGFVHYKFIQQYRTLKGEGYKKGIPVDLSMDVSELVISKETIKFPVKWFIAPCSPESPVKCFR